MESKRAEHQVTEQDSRPDRPASPNSQPPEPLHCPGFGDLPENPRSTPDRPFSPGRRVAFGVTVIVGNTIGAGSRTPARLPRNFQSLRVFSRCFRGGVCASGAVCLVNWGRCFGLGWQYFMHARRSGLRRVRSGWSDGSRPAGRRRRSRSSSVSIQRADPALEVRVVAIALS